MLFETLFLFSVLLVNFCFGGFVYVFGWFMCFGFVCVCCVMGCFVGFVVYLRVVRGYVCVAAVVYLVLGVLGFVWFGVVRLAFAVYILVILYFLCCFL